MSFFLPPPFHVALRAHFMSHHSRESSFWRVTLTHNSILSATVCSTIYLLLAETIWVILLLCSSGFLLFVSWKEKNRGTQKDNVHHRSWKILAKLHKDLSLCLVLDVFDLSQKAMTVSSDAVCQPRHLSTIKSLNEFHSLFLWGIPQRLVLTQPRSLFGQRGLKRCVVMKPCNEFLQSWLTWNVRR